MSGTSLFTQQFTFRDRRTTFEINPDARRIPDRSSWTIGADVAQTQLPLGRTAIADIGVGTDHGLFAVGLIMGADLPFSLYGVDMDENRINWAQRNVAAALRALPAGSRPHVQLSLESWVSDMRRAERRFNVVHINPDPQGRLYPYEGILREVTGICHPGAVLYVRTPTNTARAREIKDLIVKHLGPLGSPGKALRIDPLTFPHVMKGWPQAGQRVGRDAVLIVRLP
jgi:hypothetical protein